MRKWLKKIMRQAVAEQFGEAIHKICCQIGQWEHELEDLNHKIPAIYYLMEEKSEMFDTNLERLNVMVNEVKGVVAMTRAMLPKPGKSESKTRAKKR